MISNPMAFRKIFVGALIIMATALSFFVIAPSVSAYDPLEQACSGAAASSAPCQDAQGGTSNPLTGPDGLIIKAARIVAAIVGVASILMIILGGYTYTLSNGDPQKLNAAKNTILYAIVGLVIAVSAQVLIAFIVNKIL